MLDTSVECNNYVSSNSGPFSVILGGVATTVPLCFAISATDQRSGQVEKDGNWNTPGGRTKTGQCNKIIVQTRMRKY